MNIDDTDFAFSAEPIENPYPSGIYIGYNDPRNYFFADERDRLYDELPGYSYGVGKGIFDYDLLSILRPGQYTQQRCDKNSFPYNSLDFPGIGLNLILGGSIFSLLGISNYNEFQSFSATRQLKYNFEEFIRDGVTGYIDKANEIFNREPLTLFYYGYEFGTGLKYLNPTSTNSAYPFEQASGTYPSFSIFPSGTVDINNAAGIYPVVPAESGMFTVLRPSTAILLPITQTTKIILDMQQNIQNMYDNPKLPKIVDGSDWNYAVHPSWHGDEATLCGQLLTNGNSSFHDGALRFAMPLSYSMPYLTSIPISFSMCDILGNNAEIPIPCLPLNKTLQLCDLNTMVSGWYTFDNYDGNRVSIEKSENNYGIPFASGGSPFIGAINQINMHRAHYRNLWASQLNYPSGVNLRYNSGYEVGTQYTLGASGQVPDGSWDNSIPSGILDLTIPPMEFIKTELNFSSIGNDTINADIPAVEVPDNTFSIGYDLHTSDSTMLVEIYDRFGEHYTLPSGLINYNIKPYLLHHINSLSEYGLFSWGPTAPRYNLLPSSGILYSDIDCNKNMSRFYNRLPHTRQFEDSNTFRGIIYNVFSKYGGITPHTIPTNEKPENLIVQQLSNIASISGLLWIESDRTNQRVFELSTDDIYRSQASGFLKLDINTGNPAGDPILTPTLRYNSQPESNISTKMLNPWNTIWSESSTPSEFFATNLSFVPITPVCNSAWHVNHIIASGSVRMDVRFYKRNFGGITTDYITPGPVLFTVRNKKNETLYEIPTIGELNASQIASGLATFPDPGLFSTTSNVVSMLLPFTIRVNNPNGNTFGYTVPFLTYPDPYNPRIQNGRTFYLVGQDYYNYRGLSGIMEVNHPGTGTDFITGIPYDDTGLSTEVLSMKVFTNVVTDSRNFYAPNQNEYTIFDLNAVNIDTGNGTTYTETDNISFTGNYNIANKYWPD